jgi:hypothetical protein
MNAFRTRRRALVTLGLLGTVAVLLWVVWRHRPNPHWARAKELRQQLASEQGRKLSNEQRRELMGRLKTEMEKLPPAQRRDLFREKQQKDMKRYFAMSKQEKQKHLDSQIDRMEQWRREAAANKGAGPGTSPPSKRRTTDPEEREKRKKERLDRTTPEERAQRAEFFKDLQARRQQRGLGGFAPPGRRG